jgi:hypothetical protein
MKQPAPAAKKCAGRRVVATITVKALDSEQKAKATASAGDGATEARGEAGRQAQEIASGLEATVVPRQAAVTVKDKAEEGVSFLAVVRVEVAEADNS